jgi:hypothetical protein
MRTVIDLHTRRRLGASGVSVGPLSFGGNALSNPCDVVNEAQVAALPIPAEFWRSASGAQAGSGRLTEARS